MTAANEPGPILQAEGISKSFGSGPAEVRAVDEVSLQVARGELVLIMGPSGSGKTTLLSMLGALLTPDRGRVEIDGIDVTALPPGRRPALRAQRIGFVFQAFNLLEALTVEDNILFPAQLAPGGVAAARPRARELLERFELLERRHALPATLSGGEQQRVAIARALVNRPPLILADEPTGNLDSQKGQEVVMLLHDIARDEGRAVVMVTHDPRVEDVADRILWLEDGALRDRRSEPHHWVRDPVCGMRVDEWTASERLEIGGRSVVFCSKRCRERFAADPRRYLGQVNADG
ncbi:ATP-binding cassette domain-containing protein [Thiohalobacter sp.]|uniref:ATP-binding cassette domain-containing protein n=1 Tax=Thiohalobacter sp. TaxID=2025948 RepID=UPI002629B328|nr:ATP-binding cassette domain-containing protein [Thiohalobacter sp.]